MASEEVRDAYHQPPPAKSVSSVRRWLAAPFIRPAELKIPDNDQPLRNGSQYKSDSDYARANSPYLTMTSSGTELAKLAGYGTVHLGTTTVRVLREVSERMYRARHINHRFGEGASPRLRQIERARRALRRWALMRQWFCTMQRLESLRRCELASWRNQ